MNALYSVLLLTAVAWLAVLSVAWLREWRATHHPLCGRVITFSGGGRAVVRRVESNTTLTVGGG